MFHRNCKRGYIYVIASKKHSLMKIGLSVNPQKRLMELMNHYQDKTLSFVRVVDVSNMLRVEEYLHDSFRPRHIKDEWYQLSNDDIVRFDEVIEKVRNHFRTGDYFTPQERYQ